MTKSFECSAAGVPCRAKITGETDEEVLEQAVEHAKEKHGVDLAQSRAGRLREEPHPRRRRRQGGMSAGAGIGWWIGWGVALVVILIAATLLLTIIALGRRIVRQADEITAAIDGGRENTTPLFDVTRTNSAIDRITRGLRAVRTGEPQPPPDPPPRPGEGHGPGEALRDAWKDRE